MLNSWYVKNMDVRRGSRQGRFQGAIAPPITYKLTLFTTTVYNSEDSIRDVRPFCSHCFVRAMLSSLLLLFYSSDPVMRLEFQILLKSPPKLIGWIRLCVKTGICPSLEIGTKNQNFLESFTSVAQFRLTDLFLAMTVCLSV